MSKYRGLSLEEVKKRRNLYGINEIKRKKKTNPIKIFLAQFTSPIILLLIFASIISFLINFINSESYLDSILILIIIFASAIAGFIQEYKAEKTIESLQKLATPKARVIREGKEVEVNATEIVPGDIIVIEGGDVIPADAKIIEGNLEVNESILTGESKSIKKKKGDFVYLGTGVYTGKGYAEVYAIGMQTKLGKIAEKMQEIKEEASPFQEHMQKFTKKLVFFTLLLIILTFAVGFKKFGIMQAFLLSVSLAVAAIPEDLPAVITIALSLGAKQMAKKKALIRKLAITESVGCVDVICTDKTGTITEGKMKVRDFWFLDNTKSAREIALKICYYCNDARQIFRGKEIKWIGDETDIALKEYTTHFVEEEGIRKEEVPFSSERKLMSVAHKFKNDIYVFSKGALEVILKNSSYALIKNKKVKLNDKLKNQILAKNRELSSKGYRVLGLAYKEYSKPLEKNLIFVGLVILSDPPRKGVREAIQECYNAGIRIIMITGDNKETALAIAKEVGIKTKGVLEGKDLDSLCEEDIRNYLKKGINVFARVSPFHKLKLLELLKKEGHVVAMTGDGVNDALALKRADVGISMGMKGTEVAKEASDIILLDDNFASIRNAIKEGRRIFDNIRKFVNYLLTCNLAEVLVIFYGTLVFPFILLYPIQILWINLLTDGLPALALSLDPPQPKIMSRKPRKRKEGVINKKLAFLIGSIGIKKAMMLLIIFSLTLPLGLDKARTSLFTAFILYEFVRIGVIRYNENFFSLKGWLANKFLLLSLIFSLLLQIILIYSPFSTYFKIIPLGTYEWLLLIITAVIGFTLGIIITKISKFLYKD